MTNLPVIISIGDPWEFGEALSWPQPHAVVMALERTESADVALVRLNEPIQFRRSICRFLVGHPRYVGESIADVMVKESVTCAFLAITDQAAQTTMWMHPDVHKRCEFSFIGSIRKIG